MTDKQAFELIGQRAKVLANDESVKKQCQEMHKKGASVDEIQSFVYKLAIATLCDSVERSE